MAVGIDSLEQFIAGDYNHELQAGDLRLGFAVGGDASGESEGRDDHQEAFHRGEFYHERGREST